MPIKAHLYTAIGSSKELLLAIIADPSLLRDVKELSEFQSLCKKVSGLTVPKAAAAAADDDDDDDDDMPPLSSADDEDDDDLPPVPPSKKASAPAAAAPPKRVPVPVVEIEDAERVKEESDPAPATFENASEDVTSVLPDAKFEELQSAAQAAKDAASSASSDADALSSLTSALSHESALGQLSAATYAKRGEVLLRLKRCVAARADGEAAVKLNPDSARGLRLRGMSKRFLGDYAGAAKDIGDAQRIDFNDAMVPVQAFLKTAVETKLKVEAAQREQEKDDLRQKVKDRKEANERARAAREAEEEEGGSGMPGGMGGGMPMGGMDAFMKDPAFAAAMKKPGVAQKFQAMMSNPQLIMQYMNDPDIGPLIQKMMGSMPGGMGGMGGMPGGMGGMGGGMPPRGGAAHDHAHGEACDHTEFDADEDFSDMPELD